jgi:hypothetical protein
MKFQHDYVYLKGNQYMSTMTMIKTVTVLKVSKNVLMEDGIPVEVTPARNKRLVMIETTIVMVS